eukprot:5067163-Pyramimonas_sp.AAC.1
MCSSPHSFLTIADVKPTRAALYVAAQAPAPLPSQSTYFYHSRAKQRRVQSERQLGRRRRGTGSEPSLGTVVPGVTFHSLHLPELWSNSIPKHPVSSMSHLDLHISSDTHCCSWASVRAPEA